MPIEVVYYMFSKGDLKKRLQFQLISQCAPFLKGIKVASILNIEEKGREELPEIFEGTDISYEVLTTAKGRCLVLFYREETLKEHLQKSDVQEFLEPYGYKFSNVTNVLSHLKSRVEQYSRKDICFPHEIGAFLDYPIDDVKCFMEEESKEPLLIGYWKVYNHPERARMTFTAYDKEKDNEVNEFLMGKSLREIVYHAA